MRPNRPMTAAARLAALLFATFALLWQASALAQPELLPADQAFDVKASADEGEIRFDFRVTEGYHLYRDKLVITGEDGLELGDPVLPEAVIDDDPVFGKTPVYKKDFTAVTPVESASGGKATVTVEYQGCSDIHGVCYPPQTRQLTVDLPASAAQGKTS
ncbi:MAG: protein-disulfide reductase DsbD N-terminal domain-containing protein, partial [Halothiobacillaceae bacterium]|nr:protein-disulfide reductase DsbD N-terminal domain-containing protein [Halothiobacillaceae bacterium]